MHGGTDGSRRLWLGLYESHLLAFSTLTLLGYSVALGFKGVLSSPLPEARVVRVVLYILSSLFCINRIHGPHSFLFCSHSRGRQVPRPVSPHQRERTTRERSLSSLFEGDPPCSGAMRSSRTKQKEKEKNESPVKNLRSRTGRCTNKFEYSYDMIASSRSQRAPAPQHCIGTKSGALVLPVSFVRRVTTPVHPWCFMRRTTRSFLDKAHHRKLL